MKGREEDNLGEGKRRQGKNEKVERKKEEQGIRIFH